MKIEKYDFGEIIINSRKYTKDLIIFPNRVRENWWRKEGHALCIEDLKEVIDYKPEILIIGTGYLGVMRVPEDVVKEVEKMGIKILIEVTKKAVQIFNKETQKGKKVVCALHLTC